mmetsp:Transcript_37061/g.116006  ORF Transcript_37061/g.116006 Transcript_37061/m.116006 type:complete len:268 (-) Transcript_37061:61-864(-)
MRRGRRLSAGRSMRLLVWLRPYSAALPLLRPTSSSRLPLRSAYQGDASAPSAVMPAPAGATSTPAVRVMLAALPPPWPSSAASGASVCVTCSVEPPGPAAVTMRLPPSESSAGGGGTQSSRMRSGTPSATAAATPGLGLRKSPAQPGVWTRSVCAPLPCRAMRIVRCARSAAVASSRLRALTSGSVSASRSGGGGGVALGLGLMMLQLRRSRRPAAVTMRTLSPGPTTPEAMGRMAFLGTFVFIEGIVLRSGTSGAPGWPGAKAARS